MNKYVMVLENETRVEGGPIPTVLRDLRSSSSWAKAKSEKESQKEGAKPKTRLVTKPEIVK